jgi:hypothetical protein
MRLAQVVRHLSVRLDAKAVELFSKLSAIFDSTLPLGTIAEVRDLAPCEKPAEPFAYHEISSVDDYGMGEPYWIDEGNIEPGSEEERILTKINRGDIATPRTGTVLIPKVRPHLGKFVLVRKADDTYYTTAFLEARPKGVSAELLYCVLKHPAVLGQIYCISSIGKGYPTVSPFDLTRLARVPPSLLAIEPEMENAVRQQVRDLFNGLLKIRKEREFIDAVFEDRLGFKEQELPPATPWFKLPLSGMGMSFDLRMSAHFVQPASAAAMQRVRQSDDVKIARLCALPISLGVSPELYLGESGYYYLGPQAMATERLNLEKLDAITDQFYKTMEPLFGVQRGDVFLRRSGASLGKVLHLDTDLPCIFSDFMMRIRFRDPGVGKYAAYWMRSTTFQKLIKTLAVVGKGLQNIYPYQVALMPIPSPQKHNFEEIVKEVDQEVSRNDRVKAEARHKVVALKERLSQDLGFAVLEPLLQKDAGL